MPYEGEQPCTHIHTEGWLVAALTTEGGSLAPLAAAPFGLGLGLGLGVGLGVAPLAAARIHRSMVLVDARARAVSWRKGTPALISCAVAHCTSSLRHEGRA